MYLALFVTPWMIIYALSGLVLNHGAWVRGIYGAKFNAFEQVADRPYATVFSSDADPRQIGGQILEELGLSGTFNVQGNATSARLVVNRNAAFSAHRVTYFRAENRLLVEKQSFVTPVFLNRLHFRHGYEQPFLAARLWAVTVDLAVVAMLFWAVSGIWMWWEIKPARAWGAVCAAAGFALFGVLFVNL